MQKLKVLTVLKFEGQRNKGGCLYTPEHVYKIQRMCEKYLSNFKFMCLSDIDLECETIKLVDDWPGWWSKIEMYKQEGPILYFDLDTIICGNIDGMINRLSGNNFAALSDQWHPNTLGSGMMYWEQDMSHLYKTFKKNSSFYIRQYVGDQNFMNDQVSKASYLQTLCPGEIVSFKANLNYGRHFDSTKHKIVFFHGPPRPWEQGVIPY